MEGRAPFLAALTLLVAISACESKPVPTPTVPEPTATLDATACQQRIAAVDLAKESTILDVEGCRFTPGGESAARQVLTAGGTRDQLWAAVWVYGSTAQDAAPLLPLVQHADPSVRVMAGTAVAASGDRAGLDVLISGLAENTTLAGSSPPGSIAEFAALGLSRVVVAPGAPSGTGPQASPIDEVAAWRGWLEAHAAELVFDSTARQWRLP